MTSWTDYSQGANPFISATRILEVVGNAGMQQLTGDKGNQFWVHTLIPAITMKAFSCELMLKALVSYETNFEVQHIHKLNELFEKLSPSRQDELKTDLITAMKLHNPSYDSASFQNDLNEAANLFVDWRYFFEQSTSENPKTVNLTFLDNLFKVLEKKKNLLA